MKKNRLDQILCIFHFVVRDSSVFVDNQFNMSLIASYPFVLIWLTFFFHWNAEVLDGLV